MKQKFYDYVDKYMTAMNVNLEDYNSLSDATLAEIAFSTAKTCRQCFDCAWDYEDAHIEGVAPDLGDEKLKEKCVAIAKESEEKEYEEIANNCALRRFVEMICHVEDIDAYCRVLRKCFNEFDQKAAIQFMDGIAFMKTEEVNNNE